MGGPLDHQWRVSLILAVATLVVLLPAAQAQPGSSGTNADAVALLGFKSSFSNGQELLPSWQSQYQDPCGGWEGVSCTQDPASGSQRVTTL